MNKFMHNSLSPKISFFGIVLKTVFLLALAAQSALANGDLRPSERFRRLEPGIIEAATAELETLQDHGRFVLSGTPNDIQLFQSATLLYCKPEQGTKRELRFTRSSCADKTIRADLNQPLTLPVGHYLLSYENSLYPGFIEIRKEQETRLDLVPLPFMPIASQGKVVKVYRDLQDLIEQKKIYFEFFSHGSFLRKLTAYSEGHKDFYIRAWGNHDAFSSLRVYQYCDTFEQKLRTGAVTEQQVASLPSGAYRLCKAIRTMNYMAMSEFFDFRSRATMVQKNIDSIGYVMNHVVDRLLVAPPINVSKVQSGFINVLPGSYALEVIKEGGATEHFTFTAGEPKKLSNFGGTANPKSLLFGYTAPTFEQNNEPLSPEGQEVRKAALSCETSHLWRTEHRAYCRSDLAEGCDRTTSKICEPMAE